eukprot:NP_494175.2 Uncharacterized protein CELE_T16A1.5 [Caenorhabditis elegans]
MCNSEEAADNYCFSHKLFEFGGWGRVKLGVKRCHKLLKKVLELWQKMLKIAKSQRSLYV